MIIQGWKFGRLDRLQIFSFTLEEYTFICFSNTLRSNNSKNVIQTYCQVSDGNWEREMLKHKSCKIYFERERERERERVD